MSVDQIGAEEGSNFEEEPYEPVGIGDLAEPQPRQSVLFDVAIFYRPF